MNVSSHKHQCIGRMVLPLQRWPQDLPRGGAKQSRGTEGGRGTLSFVANYSCLCMQASARS